MAANNEEQIEFWNGEASRGWVERDLQMEQLLAPLGEAAIAAAGVTAGEHILDIGCGCGHTSIALAERVQESGMIVGADISAPMLEVARGRSSRLPEALQGAVDFVETDASTHAFSAQSFDLLFSRFGVMFFDDPTAAFANMREALKPGGRLAFICWAPVPENQWITVPMGVAFQHVSPPEPPPPNAPGPFAFADPAYTEGVLTGAGFTDVALAAYKPHMHFGHGQTLAEIAEFFVEMGPLSRVLAEASPEQSELIRRDIGTAIEPFYDGEAVSLGASCWIVTARNPD